MAEVEATYTNRKSGLRPSWIISLKTDISDATHDGLEWESRAGERKLGDVLRIKRSLGMEKALWSRIRAS